MAKRESPTMPKASKNSLEQLLRRPDIWRGHSHAFVPQTVIDSGYPELNQALQQGWPSASMVEVCQHYHASEWYLFHPAINALMQTSPYAHLALLNPPALPFISGLQHWKIDTQRLLVIQTNSPQEFVTSFCELSQSPACPIVLAWQNQPNTKRAQNLNYTQLRKLQLSASEQEGLYVLFRDARAQEQSSPASLRLSIQTQRDNLHIHIFKQKGKLRGKEIELPIPKMWQSLVPHRELRKDKEQNNNRYTASNKGQVTLFPKITSRPLKRIVKRDYSS